MSTCRLIMAESKKPWQGWHHSVRALWVTTSACSGPAPNRVSNMYEVSKRQMSGITKTCSAQHRTWNTNHHSTVAPSTGTRAAPHLGRATLLMRREVRHLVRRSDLEVALEELLTWRNCPHIDTACLVWSSYGRREPACHRGWTQRERSRSVIYCPIMLFNAGISILSAHTCSMTADLYYVVICAACSWRGQARVGVSGGYY